MQEKLNKLKNEIKENLQLKLKELQTQHPFIESISWQQYTPYFNDGDPCVFRTYIKYDNIWINNINIYGELLNSEPSLSNSEMYIVDDYYENKNLIDEYLSKDLFTKDDMDKFQDIGKLIKKFNNLDNLLVEKYLNQKNYISFTNNYTEKELDEIYNNAAKIFEDLSKNDFLFIFGDHSLITIKESEIQIEISNNHD